MTPKPPGSNALVFIFITVLIDMIGLGIMIPVMPELITSVTGDSIAQAATDGGYLLITFAVAQFFFAPVLGNLSDRFGRRPVLLASLAGYTGDFLLMAVAPTLAWLFIGRLLSGVFSATYATATAYIADVSPPEKRAGNFGLIGVAFGIGFVVGPALGGVLGEYGARVPFYAAAALTFCNLIYGYFVLPETLSPEKRRPFTWRRANPIGSLYQMRRRPVILGLLASLFLLQLGHYSLPSVWSYYTIEKFDWSEAQIGLSMTAWGLLAGLVQGFATRIVVRRIGEVRTLMIGIAATSIAFTGYALAVAGWQIYPWIVLGAVGGMALPSLQGIMSNAMPADQQGELQGAVSSTMSISMIAGPLLMTRVFTVFSDKQGATYFPGAPFITAAALTALAFVPVVAMLLARRLRRRQSQPAE